LFLAENSNPALPDPKTPGAFTNQIAAGAQGGYSTILIDSLFTDFGDNVNGNGSANARVSALRALQSIPAGVKIAIYATGRKLQVVCEFTSDRDLLKRQLEHWKPNTDTTRASNDVLTSPLGASLGDHRGDAPLEAFAATVRMDAQLRAASNEEEMSLVADHLAGLPGRKNLIWLSDRFAIGPQALRKLTAAGVSIYPVDVDGVPCGGDWCPPLSRPTSQMDRIAALTGGVAYHGRNDIDVAIRAALDDGRVSYTLGFYRNDDDPKDTAHHIDIRVSRPGVALRYSAVYQTEAHPPVSADRQTDLVNAMNRPIDANAIPISASLTRSPESLNLKAVLDVTSLELTQSADRWRGRMEIVARFTAADGKPVGEIFTQTMDLHLSQTQHDSALQHGLPFLTEMKIPSRAAELKLLFTDLTSGKIGTLAIPLSEVPKGAAK
jgi:VWFA-related protein